MKLSSVNLRLSTTLVVAALSLTLGACTQDELAIDTKYTPNSGSEQYPIKVARGPITLNVANKSGTLQATQINAVADFARDAAVSGVMPVTISRPAGASSRLASEIANLMVQQGVSSHAIHMATYSGAAGGPVKITYRTPRATVAKCGNWSEDISNTKFNEPMPNLGCAVQTNIAAMVINPDDFNGPQPTDPVMASTRIPAVVKLETSSTSSSSSSTPAVGGSGSGSGSGSTN